MISRIEWEELLMHAWGYEIQDLLSRIEWNVLVFPRVKDEERLVRKIGDWFRVSSD